MAKNEMLTVAVRKLRSRGYTYTEIQNKLGRRVPKGTLSYMCRGVSLPKSYSAKIVKLNLRSAKKARRASMQANDKRKAARLQELYRRNLYLLQKTDHDSLKIALAMLYLGEGAKWHGHRGLMLGSSDPNIVKIYMKLLKECYDIPTADMRARISYRADQNIDALTKFWHNVTRIPVRHFYRTKPDSRTAGKPTKKKDYRGVCVITCAGTEIQLELAAIAKVLAENLR